MVSFLERELDISPPVLYNVRKIQSRRTIVQVVFPAKEGFIA